MRLQLSALALGALVGGASADVGGGGALRVYADDDDMTVVSPSVSAQVEAGETTIDAELLADVVSGASIDVITSASPRPVEEQRAELGIKATTAVHPRGAARVDAGLRASSERDHHAVRGSAGIRVEVWERRWTLAARYVAGLDEVGAVGEPGVWRERTLHQPSAGVTAVLDARTVAELAVEGAWTSGYQASPYRRVPLVDPAAPVPTTVVTTPFGAIARTLLLPVSTTSTVPSESRAMARGALNVAAIAGPPSPLLPATPVPATVTAVFVLAGAVAGAHSSAAVIRVGRVFVTVFILIYLTRKLARSIDRDVEVVAVTCRR